MSVQVNGGIHVDAAEVNEVLLASVADGERLAIPTDTARKSTSSRPRRIVLAEVAFDRPIVWKVQFTPSGIVVIRLDDGRVIS